MLFESLKIEVDKWGPDKGKLKAVIDIKGGKGSTTLQLPDKVAEQILQLAKNAIIDGVEKTANEFIFELTTSIPETLHIGN